MPFLGAAFRAVAGITNTLVLRRKIGRAETRLAVPIVDKYSGAQRYEIAERLAEVRLIHDLENNPASLSDAKKLWKETVTEELKMAEKELEQQYASRAEVVALGIAVRELALNLDEQVKAFQEKAKGAFAELEAGKSQWEAATRKGIQLAWIAVGIASASLIIGLLNVMN